MASKYIRLIGTEKWTLNKIKYMIYYDTLEAASNLIKETDDQVPEREIKILNKLGTNHLNVDVKRMLEFYGIIKNNQFQTENLNDATLKHGFMFAITGKIERGYLYLFGDALNSVVVKFNYGVKNRAEEIAHVKKLYSEIKEYIPEAFDEFYLKDNWENGSWYQYSGAAMWATRLGDESVEDIKRIYQTLKLDYGFNPELQKIVTYELPTKMDLKLLRNVILYGMREPKGFTLGLNTVQEYELKKVSQGYWEGKEKEPKQNPTVTDFRPILIKLNELLLTNAPTTSKFGSPSGEPSEPDEDSGKSDEDSGESDEDSGESFADANDFTAESPL